MIRTIWNSNCRKKTALFLDGPVTISVYVRVLRLLRNPLSVLCKEPWGSARVTFCAYIKRSLSHPRSWVVLLLVPIFLRITPGINASCNRLSNSYQKISDIRNNKTFFFEVRFRAKVPIIVRVEKVQNCVVFITLIDMKCYGGF